MKTLGIVLGLSSALVSQSNTVAGLDSTVYNLGDLRVNGRRGPAYPNGEVGITNGHSFCNSGSVHIPWTGSSGGLMIDTYPKIAFMIARLSNGRMVQVSGKSFLKHSRIAFNFSSGPCGPCTSGPSNHHRIGCSDTYSTGFNGNRYNLGPTTEVNPWLGTWDSQNSYFDRGDPAVSGPAAFDRVQSLTSSQTNSFDSVKNRMIVPEAELAVSGQFFTQVHLMIQGEAVANRADNIRNRGCSFNWSGSSWSDSWVGSSLNGSVLTRWPGASLNQGQNGNDDGRFLVAVNVTGPVNGMWHYEYAIHNLDNDRGGASLRLPVCPTARVENAGFRDIDSDSLNDWSFSRSGGEISFLATPSNAIDWNTIYNFWFDSDAAPVAGTSSIDQARIGPGALSVNVATEVPGLLGNEFLGAGCGTNAPELFGNTVPSVPNFAYALNLHGTPSSTMFLSMSFGSDNQPLGGGCTQYIDTGMIGSTVFLFTNPLGQVSYNLPIPAALPPFDLYCQGAAFTTGGAVLGQLDLSNGLRVRIGGTGCP